MRLIDVACTMHRRYHASQEAPPAQGRYHFPVKNRLIAHNTSCEAIKTSGMPSANNGLSMMASMSGITTPTAT